MPENIIYVGNKPVMNYVLAVVTQINNGSSEINLKARGRAISRAVDVAEIVKNKLANIDIYNITTCTEEISNEDGTTTNISAIELNLRKD